MTDRAPHRSADTRNRRWPRARTASRAATVLLATSLLVVLASPGSASGSPGCELKGGEERTVARVVDGETVVLDGGSEVRLIGALAPRAFDATGGGLDWPLADRAREAVDRLVTGRTVTLAFAGRRVDRYGRLLAHVFAPPPARESAAEPVWVQGALLSRGLARAYALDHDAQCFDELVSHEALARATGAGLWKERTYALRDAAEVAALARLAGTFQLVEGRIAAVAEVRGTTYLNFGDDHRQDFTVTVKPNVKRALTAAGRALDGLEGNRVRVRGWIERRGGPMLDLLHPGALEIVSGPTAGAEETQATPPRRRLRRRATAE